MQNKVRITKKFEFSASHRYWRDEWSEEKNRELFGLCTSPYGHGHNYVLHVTISGDIDEKSGMIINLSDLKKTVNEVVAEFDHKFVNLDTPYFKEQIPTSENIALVIFRLIDQKLKAQKHFHLHKIRLYERTDLYVDVWQEQL